ncbi:Hypothetical protein DAL_30 [Psychrobacter phage D'Alembert]|nr:Hypothetical protein DAL_30 [Psychrobacter phage D'Alembert]
MKLSKYIELLQRTLDCEGDLEVVQSDVDNDMEIEFYKKEYVGGILYFEDLDDLYIQQVDVEELDEYPDAVKAFCIN